MHYGKNLLSLIKISEYYSPYALNNITWCCAIGTPNIFLSKEYFVASSRALCARPTPPAATYRHHQQNANGNHNGFYHVTGTPWAMQSLRSWRCLYSYFSARQNINADSIKCKISRRNWQIKNAVMWSHYAYRGGDKKQKLHWKIIIVRQEYTTGNGMGKDDCCGRQWRHKGNKTDSFDW
jgi:hypothetical protein